MPNPAASPRLHALARLAWPVVLSRLGIMVMGVTDAIVVGRYSAEELAYQSLGWTPTMVVLTTGIGLLFGVQVLTAQLVGEGRRLEAGAVLQRGLALSVLLGAAVAAILGLGAYPFMRLLQLEGDLGPEAAAVVEVLAISMPLYLIGVCCSYWLEALERPVPGMVVMWTANVVNLGLNLWLVPGTSPFAVDGAVASAWTTLFSRGFYALGLIGVILFWAEARALGIFIVRRAADFHHYWGRMLKVGAATSVSYFVETVGFAGMNVIAGWIGAAAVAGFAVIFNVAGLVFMLPLGISTATAVMVGKSYGEHDRRGIRSAGLLGLTVTAALLVAISVAVLPLRELIVGAYSGDPALAAVVVPALLLAALFFPLDGLQVIAASALRAAEDAWVPTLTHTISYVVVMLPLGYWLGVTRGEGVTGLMWTMIAVSLLASCFLIGRFLWLFRRGRAVPAPA